MVVEMGDGNIPELRIIKFCMIGLCFVARGSYDCWTRLEFRTFGNNKTIFAAQGWVFCLFVTGIVWKSIEWWSVLMKVRAAAELWTLLCDQRNKTKKFINFHLIDTLLWVIFRTNEEFLWIYVIFKKHFFLWYVDLLISPDEDYFQQATKNILRFPWSHPLKYFYTL